MVISARTPGGAYQAAVRRSSLEFALPHVTRSTIDRGCDAPLERFRVALADRALGGGTAPPAGPVGAPHRGARC
jgi:hypothetical protein